MKSRQMLGSLLVLAALCIPIVAVAQAGEDFSDPQGRFKLRLMGDWKSISYSDAVGRKRVEFVYRDRSEGLLRISKESSDSLTAAEMARREEETIRIYRHGYERVSLEPFGGGALSGVRLAFYSTEGGRQLASTFYFLEDGNSVWALRFSGRRGAVDTIRNVTDQMARSFEPR